MSSRPSLRPTLSAVVRLSPVSMTLRIPVTAQRGQRADSALLDRIGEREEPGRRAVERNQMTLWASLSHSACGRARRLDAERCEKNQIADSDPPSLGDPNKGFPGLGGRRAEPIIPRTPRTATACRAARGCCVPSSRLHWRFERHAADRAATGPSALHLRMHRPGPDNFRAGNGCFGAILPSLASFPHCAERVGCEVGFDFGVADTAEQPGRE
jgi:hypothetical protein